MARRKPEPDFLDEMIAEGAKRDPDFPKLVEAAYERQMFAHRLARRRKRLGLSQTEVASRMKTSQAMVSKVEHGADVQVSTLERYAGALGLRLRLQARKAS